MPELLYGCEYCEEVFDMLSLCELHEKTCPERKENMFLKDVRRFAKNFVPSIGLPSRFKEMVNECLLGLDTVEAREHFTEVLVEEPIPCLCNCGTCRKNDGQRWDVECLKANDFPRLFCPRWEFDAQSLMALPHLTAFFTHPDTAYIKAMGV